MGVIDVDSHWWEPLTWLQDSDSDLQEVLHRELPPQSFAEVIFGEVVAQLPEDQRESFFDIPTLKMMGGMRPEASTDLAEIERRLQESPMAAIINQPGARDAASRLEWADAEGIDLQIINPTLPLATQHELRRHRPDLLNRFCEAYNRWTIDRIDGHSDRLAPTAMVNFGDPAWTIAELERMRTAGSRSYLVPMYPVDGRSIAHVDFEDIWSASVDLGMIPVFHVASGSVTFDPGWCRTGRDNTAQTAFLLAASQNPQIAQVPLAAMVVNGVFERHPDLVVLCSEFSLSWVPGWMDQLGTVSRHGTPNISMLVGWPWPKRAHEYVARNIRFSPLPNNLVYELTDELGVQSVLFATDYPHPEGSAKAVGHFHEQLDDRFSDAELAAFFEGNARDLLDGRAA